MEDNTISPLTHPLSMAYVLIVSHNKRVRNTLVTALRQHYQVHIANNATIATRLLQRHLTHHIIYDVVVTEPLYDSVQHQTIIDIARALPNPPDVIMISADISDETFDNAVAALHSGAFDYIPIPHDIPYLTKRVAQAVQHCSVMRHQSFAFEHMVMLLFDDKYNNVLSTQLAVQQTPTYRVGNITLNSSNHKVTVNDVSLTLTRIEFAILECLMQTPGHAVSFQTMIDYAYEYNTDKIKDDANQLLRAHIRNLRSKIGGKQYIVNVYGIGYKLVVEEHTEQSS